MTTETKNKFHQQCHMCSIIEEHVVTADNFMELANKFKNTNTHTCTKCSDLLIQTHQGNFPDDQIYPYPKYYMQITFDQTAYSNHYLGQKTMYFPVLKIFKKDDMHFTGKLDLNLCRKKLQFYELPKNERSAHAFRIEMVKAEIHMDKRLLIDLN